MMPTTPPCLPMARSCSSSRLRGCALSASQPECDEKTGVLDASTRSQKVRFDAWLTSTMMPSRLHSATSSRPSVDSPPSFFLSNELTPALLVLFQQMPKKRTPASASFCSARGVVLDGERAFDAEKERDLAGGFGAAQIAGRARAHELGMLFEQPFEFFELLPEALAAP